jgi:hypothetical protein
VETDGSYSMGEGSPSAKYSEDPEFFDNWKVLEQGDPEFCTSRRVLVQSEPGVKMDGEKDMEIMDRVLRAPGQRDYPHAF